MHCLDGGSCDNHFFFDYNFYNLNNLLVCPSLDSEWSSGRFWGTHCVWVRGYENRKEQFSVCFRVTALTTDGLWSALTRCPLPLEVFMNPLVWSNDLDLYADVCAATDRSVYFYSLRYAIIDVCEFCYEISHNLPFDSCCRNVIYFVLTQLYCPTSKPSWSFGLL